MKNYLFLGIAASVIVVIAVLAIFLMGSGTQNLSGEEKFREFSAEVYCASYKFSMNENANEEEFNKEMLDLLEKYDYTQDEAYGLIEDYADDIEFQKSVLEKLKKLCPEAVPSFEYNIEQYQEPYGHTCLEEGKPFNTFNKTKDAPCCEGLDKVVYFGQEYTYDNESKLICTSKERDNIVCIDCGNGVCSLGENPCICPEDCGKCGDSICDSPVENYISCPEDCEYKEDCIMTGYQGGGFENQGLDCCEGLEKKPIYINSDCEVRDTNKDLFVCIDCDKVVCGNPINKCRCPEECL